MKIVKARPKYMWILQLFFPFDPVKATISFGDTIYSSGELSEDLIEHEKTHLDQQRHSNWYATWFTVKYIVSQKFRYEMELEAFRKQYKYAKDHYPADKVVYVLDWSARMLMHPAYKFKRISWKEATTQIQKLV